VSLWKKLTPLLELNGKRKRAKLNKKHRAHSCDHESDEEEWLTHTHTHLYRRTHTQVFVLDMCNTLTALNQTLPTDYFPMCEFTQTCGGLRGVEMNCVYVCVCVSGELHDWHSS